ncbi:MAG: FKBP-type peptidyl-prolyl cis-trans isomerase [Bradymonadia bacterium]
MSVKTPEDVAAAPADAIRTASGLAYRVLQAGTGKDRPSASSQVEVHYSGWMTNGELFDSSVTRGTPAAFPLDRVIAGWTEGLQLMTVGEKTRFWIPGRLAYGEEDTGSGRPFGTLVFDVELLSFKEPPAPPETPDDLTAPPADAITTDSGLVYRVLKEGSGDDRPLGHSKVEVHYSGWMADGGRLFDSSIVRGEPISFGLDQVIPGWTEGVQLMKVGEKARFWIPGHLAYGDAPSGGGRPHGTLVFDVELLSFTNPPAPPAAPDDLKTPPEDAVTTESGLIYRLLEAGDGGGSPTAESNVHVHYSGWMASNGELFDSSVVRGEPISFGLNQVIPGWREGLQLMTTGEKARLWIPGHLAYGDAPSRPGMPYGTLVFDVELLSFS